MPDTYWKKRQQKGHGRQDPGQARGLTAEAVWKQSEAQRHDGIRCPFRVSERWFHVMCLLPQSKRCLRRKDVRVSIPNSDELVSSENQEERQNIRETDKSTLRPHVPPTSLAQIQAGQQSLDQEWEAALSLGVKGQLREGRAIPELARQAYTEACPGQTGRNQGTLLAWDLQMGGSWRRCCPSTAGSRGRTLQFTARPRLPRTEPTPAGDPLLDGTAEPADTLVTYTQRGTNYSSCIYFNFIPSTEKYRIAFPQNRTSTPCPGGGRRPRAPRPGGG